MAQQICIMGGQVFFSDQKRIEKKDILIAGERVSRIEDRIRPGEDTEVLDAKGKLVTPGLIDFHMHAFRYGHLLSIDTEELSPRSGTTTFVDGGSTGSLNFLAFREYVIKSAKSNILAFLNVSAVGQTTDGIQGLHFFENDDDRLLHIPSAVEVIEKNRDTIVGIKVRAYTGLKSLAPIRKARELADRVHLPIMVHLAPPPPAFREILPFLRRGDIVTHAYHGGEETIVDRDGNVRPEFHEARQMGVELDVGLDRFHGNFRVMRSALEQGFSPDYISTDLAAPNLHHLVFDLPTTLSKFVALGMSLIDALGRCTWNPALKLGKGKEIGCLQKGGFADIAIFDIMTDDHIFQDHFGNQVKSRERIRPHTTIGKGEILRPNPRRTETLDCVLTGKEPWRFEEK